MRGTWQLDKGTILKMAQTERGIVRIEKALAVLICNADNMMPASDGRSRDLPGFAADIKSLESKLPTLGFRLLPTYWNKNADEVRLLLRHVQKGFQKGGALSFHDSLLIVLTGHCDGQSVECSMDSSGQTGAMGISMLLSYFTDHNAPALQGKLKLFVFGLALGHPVNMPAGHGGGALRLPEGRLQNETGAAAAPAAAAPAAAAAAAAAAMPSPPEPEKKPPAGEHEGEPPHAAASAAAHVSAQRNVLNSVGTGGRARVFHSEGTKRAELVVDAGLQQDVEALLRSEGDEFRHHVSLSYRQEPCSGTWWRKWNFASTGVVVIDLGECVQGLNTFAVFQLAVKDAKCTSLIMQRAPESYNSSATPPEDKLKWIDVTDDRGNVDMSLFARDTSLGGTAGSIMPASRVFTVPEFSTRWLRIEMINDGTYGCVGGVGLRQIKAFCSPSWAPVAVHAADRATWVENPTAGPGGPALNRVGADSVHPVYLPPAVASSGESLSDMCVRAQGASVGNMCIRATLHPAPYTLHPTPYTLHPKPIDKMRDGVISLPSTTTRHPKPAALHAKR
jgi:hypothetical protein